MRNILISFHRGVPVYFTDNGDYEVEDGSRTIKFPTEEEADEYIDEEFEKHRYEEAGL